ncbi:MAG TPA: nickel ABC transporter permease [Chloroflexia bacterium]|jgi:peptide/nickel transport system permease protein|nr:nickel ABC transporter permease [Chloroflexia bacterium]
MSRYVLQRVLLLVPVWLGITLLAFGLGHLTPGDPARRIAEKQLDGPATVEQVEQARREHGLADPLPVQYVRWVGQAVQGDLGQSFNTGGPVLRELSDRFPATLQLAICAMLVGLGLALPLGVLAAVYRGSVLDQVSRLAALAGASLPGFWLGYLLMLLFAVHLHLLPVAGRGDWRYLILPAVTLGFGLAAPLTRLSRSSLLEALGEDYIQTARAKGLRQRTVVLQHALRNALIPVVTVAGMSFGHLLGGAVIIETVFAWPGVGKLLVDSILARDYPLIQGYVLFMGTVFVLINLGVDLLYVWIDPRIRLVAPVEGAHGSA